MLANAGAPTVPSGARGGAANLGNPIEDTLLATTADELEPLGPAPREVTLRRRLQSRTDR